jgi:uncharacterized protein YecT (DUF1311 family)
MNRLIILISFLVPIISFGQIPDSIDTNSKYESYLKLKYDSVNQILNKYYNEFISYDSLGPLKDSQKAWIKYCDSNIKLYEDIKGIPNSNTSQIKYQALINFTEQRIAELRNLYYETPIAKPFTPTGSIVSEKFFPQDIVNKIPAIKYTKARTFKNIENIKYTIISDPSKAPDKGAGNFIVTIQSLPMTTKDFIDSVICNGFLSNPARYADQFMDVNEDNVNQKVEFDLVLQPITLDYNMITDIWQFLLIVSLNGGGGYSYGISSHYFDSDGFIVKKLAEGVPEESYKNDGELFIKMFIPEDENGVSGKINLCRYDKSKREIVFVKTIGKRIMDEDFIDTDEK